MADKVADKAHKRVERLALFAATCCFLIGWWHTGVGLAYFRVLDSQYGGFVFATFILSVLLIAYWRAIEGSRSALFWYLAFASVNFVCNLNSFYPSYRSNALLRQELENHRTAIHRLSAEVDRKFKRDEQEKLKKKIEADIATLSFNINQHGFGRNSDLALRIAESDLGMKPMARPLRGNSKAEWAEAANSYVDSLNKQLDANLRAADYPFVQEVDTDEAEYSKQIGVMLDSSERIQAPPLPSIVHDVVGFYRNTCASAVTAMASFKCSAQYDSLNKNIGTFGHTLASIARTRTNGDTLTVLAICFFIDFACPLALYFLVQQRQMRPLMVRGPGWRNKEEPQELAP